MHVYTCCMCMSGTQYNTIQLLAIKTTNDNNNSYNLLSAITQPYKECITVS